MEILIVAIIAILLLVFAINLFGFALWLVWTLLGGLVVGALARLVLPGEQPMGLLATALYGVAGSLAGNLLARGLFDLGMIGQIIFSVGAAALLIAVTTKTRR